MQLFKSIAIYDAKIPNDPALLAGHLAELKFYPPLESQTVSRGFVPVREEAGDALAVPFHGGLAFRFRQDEKILPAKVIAAEVQNRIDMIWNTDGRKPGKKEKAEIKDEVTCELAARALVTTKVDMVCYYHYESSTLIVPTSSSSAADNCMSLLIRAMGSIETTTLTALTVSEAKGGLTTRMRNYLADEDCGAFGIFEPCDEVQLETTDKSRKVGVKMDSLLNAQKGINEAIVSGMKVSAMGLHGHGIDFCLTEKFRLRNIVFPVVEGDEEESTWEVMATTQVAGIVQVIKDLVELLGRTGQDLDEGGIVPTEPIEGSTPGVSKAEEPSPNAEADAAGAGGAAGATEDYVFA